MRILLVDDHTLFREALLHVLNQLDVQVVVLEAANVEEALLNSFPTRATLIWFCWILICPT
jgi:DNA-binding NarL/FixJ family response regulator